MISSSITKNGTYYTYIQLSLVTHCYEKCDQVYNKNIIGT